jgi:glucose-1-phosphate thymidylyltransferase
MTWEELEGWWTDAGTFESLLRASMLVAETGANNMDFESREVAANVRQF